jgi:hypothetical protein
MRLWTRSKTILMSQDETRMLWTWSRMILKTRLYTGELWDLVITRN